MEFDSHINGIVVTAVTVMNAVTPGLRGGREVPAPTGAALADAVNEALRATSRTSTGPLSDAAAQRMADWTVRLRAVVEDVEAGRVDAAATALNAVLRDAHAVPTLSHHDGEPWHLHFHRTDADEVEGWVAGMATGLAFVLGNPTIDRLGVCTAAACDRVYIDTSRNGSRRFCSTTCQNRIKAAAFRARRKVEEGGAAVSPAAAPRRAPATRAGGRLRPR